jgi:ubiquitin carboxyl-terminal hydrolase 8
LRYILKNALELAKKADANLDFGRPDIAYEDYLMASEIIINYLPSHKEFPDINAERGESWKLYRGLQSVRRSICTHGNLIAGKHLD